MEQLLSIRSNPLKMDLKINAARLEITSPMPSHTMRRDRGGVTMRSTQGKMHIDTFEARSSVTPTTMRMIEQAAAKGRNAAAQATAQYAREGDMMADIHKNPNSIPDIAAMKMSSLDEYGLGFLPGAPVEFNYEPATLDIQFQVDKLTFDWKVNQQQKRFVPGSIEFVITQYPSLEIEYLGSPIYVPPSSDPNYKKISTSA